MSSLSDQEKRELLRRARQLIGENDRRLQRSEWNYVLKSLFGRGGEPALKKTSELVAKLPSTSWLRQRSRQTGAYLDATKATFERIQNLGLNHAKLRFLVGWIERIIRTEQPDDNGNE